MDIQITDKERAQNVAFQIKQLLLAINQLKPQIASALTFIQKGAEGITAADLKEALGDTADDITKRLEAFNEII